MSQSHLHALEQALTEKGWRIIAVHDGDGFRISGSWELQRSTKLASLFIDFDGLEALGRFCMPLDQSYGCQLRVPGHVYLHFRKIKAQRELWQRELIEFISAFDSITSDSIGDGVID